jgi:hypothetical protein
MSALSDVKFAMDTLILQWSDVYFVTKGDVEALAMMNTLSLQTIHLSFTNSLQP